MTVSDVKARWQQLHDRVPALRLYAVVDGMQYEQRHSKRLQAGSSRFALFTGTQDAALAYAGPWLVDAACEDEVLVAELEELERDVPSLIWLLAPLDLTGLGQLLQLKLDVRLPDGRCALLRFWDPRVLINLARTLDAAQREEFFGHIHEWHFLHEGQRIRIGRIHADAH